MLWNSVDQVNLSIDPLFSCDILVFVRQALFLNLCVHMSCSFSFLELCLYALQSNMLLCVNCCHRLTGLVGAYFVFACVIIPISHM